MVEMTEIKSGKLSAFRPQVENANKHTERGLDALSKAFSEVGYVAPMTAAANGEMLDGSARLETAATQFADEAIVIHHDGKKPVIMIRDDIPDATTPLAKKISYGANRIFELDLSWDPEQLAKDIAAGVDFGGLFTEAEQKTLLAELKPEPPEDTGPQVDKAEQLQEKWQCEAGQIWQIESKVNPGHYHRLICGDCRDKTTVEALTQGKRVNGVFTSPPYAMQRAKQYGGVETDQYVDWWEAVQDNVRGVLADNGSFFVNIKPHCEDGQRVLYVFDLVLAMVRRWGWRFVDELCWRNTSNGIPGEYGARLKNAFEPVYWFTFGKPALRKYNILQPLKENSLKRLETLSERDTNGRSESDSGTGFGRNMMNFIGVNSALPSNVIEVSAQHIAGQSHQAPFPVLLPTFFIRGYSDPLDIWLDPFCGSGTTGCAAENEGRLSLMIEQLPKYCAVTLERFQTTFNITPELIT